MRRTIEQLRAEIGDPRQHEPQVTPARLLC